MGSIQYAVKRRNTSPKQRLDQLLVERGLVESRQKAQALILGGKVLVAGQRQDKAGTLVPADAAIELIGNELRYVSRGGLKLEGALAAFAIDPSGRICLDVGSSTGGFTDCLLQHGAERVFAVDVSTNQLAWKLHRDSRVVPIEMNARYLAAAERAQQLLAERPSLVTMDLSFISATKVLPELVQLAASGADFIVLVKPQFELERGDVGRGGIVRDAALHRRAVERVRKTMAETGLTVLGETPSPITGAEGNQEFFLHGRLGNSSRTPRAVG